MRPHPTLSTVRFIGLALGFALFAIMAVRAAQTANSKAAVQGVPHIVTGAAQTYGSTPTVAAVQASSFGSVSVLTPVVSAPELPATAAENNNDVASPEADSAHTVKPPMRPEQSKKQSTPADSSPKPNAGKPD